VRAAVALRDIVGKAENAFLIGIVPLQRHFGDDVVLLEIEVDRLGVQRRLVPVQVLHKGADATVILEDILFVGALVGDADADAAVEKRELSQPLRQHVVVEIGVAENLIARICTNCCRIYRRRATPS